MQQPAPKDDVLRTLHPDCPDWQRLGPTPQDAAIRAMAEAQRVAEEERDAAWAGGFNRRTFLKGGLGVGVAALGAQLVTSRVSYAAADELQHRHARRRLPPRRHGRAVDARARERPGPAQGAAEHRRARRVAARVRHRPAASGCTRRCRRSRR